MSRPNLNSRNTPKSGSLIFLPVDAAAEVEMLPAAIFPKVLALERKRAERSGRLLVLMLVESPSLLMSEDQTNAAERIQFALSRSTRDTDIKGWYRNGVIGVIFTEFPLDGTPVVKTLAGKINSAFNDSLGAHRVGEVALSFHFFPGPGDEAQYSGPEAMSINGAR